MLADKYSRLTAAVFLADSGEDGRLAEPIDSVPVGFAEKVTSFISFTPDFSQVLLRRQEIGNRLNGFPEFWPKLPPG